MTELRTALDDLQADEFPAVEFEYQVKDGGSHVHLYHFEVTDSARGIGVGATTMTDIEAIARRHDVETLSVRMGLTEPNNSGTDPTVAFLDTHGFTVESPTDGGVNAEKSL